MREIIFRGKRIDNGEWIYGSLINNVWKSAKTNSFFYHIVDMDEINKIEPHWDEWQEALEVVDSYLGVIPETVGQYTGLKDKNEKMIFEGDIINLQLMAPGVLSGPRRFYKESASTIAFIKGAFREAESLEVLADFLTCIVDHKIKYEIIGNIHKK